MVFYYHRKIGDIDPDGFYRMEHFVQGTGILFQPVYRDAACLETYNKYAKSLNKNDVQKAESQNLCWAGDYPLDEKMMPKLNL